MHLLVYPNANSRTEFDRKNGKFAFQVWTKFHRHIGSQLLIASLKPLHVERWLQSDYRKVSNNHRRNAIRAVQRTLNWAIEMGIITHSPVARMKKPGYERREAFLSQPQFDELLERVSEECFRDYLRFLWLTGCRPQEIRVIEACHVQDAMIVLPATDSKGKRFNRVIYLEVEALAIVQRLVAVNPEGPVFRNHSGKPWTANAVRLWFRRLKGERLNATILRHSWITNALRNGVDTTTVAILAGHRDTTMVQRNYQHLAKDHEYLADAARRAKGGESQKS